MIGTMDREFHTTATETFNEVVGIASRLRVAGGRAHLVGGCVRDALTGKATNDFDLEVFGLAPDTVRRVLEENYALDLVGMAFGVLKLRGHSIDVALPRRESKRGVGHRGFEIASIPDLSEKEAAARRDFTINAIAYDPLEERWIDPFGGIEDLKARRLRHTTDHFREDPLRVLRGAQFVARFELTADQRTIDMCRSMDIEDLPTDRIDGEWRKLLLQGVRPGLGLDFLKATQWLRYFPEIEALIGCEQDPEWHPEGDVFQHTMEVLDAYADQRIGERWEDLVVGFGCLCHDIGKPRTTVFVDGRWRSPGHEPEGATPTRDLLARISRESRLADAVVPLVEHHLKPRQLFDAKASDAAVRRLARKVRIDRLVRVAQADWDGRPPKPRSLDPACGWLLEQAARLELEAAAPKPLIQGRHLLDEGLSPNPRFGQILELCFERQLDGAFDSVEAGRVVLREILDSDPTLRNSPPVGHRGDL